VEGVYIKNAMDGCTFVSPYLGYLLGSISHVFLTIPIINV